MPRAILIKAEVILRKRLLISVVIRQNNKTASGLLFIYLLIYFILFYFILFGFICPLKQHSDFCDFGKQHAVRDVKTRSRKVICREDLGEIGIK